MLDSKKISKIKRLYQKGYKVSEIARVMEVDRKTVRKYINYTPDRSKPVSKLDPYKGELDRMLREDSKGTRKWTAVAMHEVLSKKHPELASSYLLIQRYAKAWRDKHSK